MLSCEQIVERLSSIVDGEAGMGDRMRFKAHLAMCKHCSAYYEQFLAVREAAGAVEPEDLPEDFDRVMAFVLDE